MRYLAYGHVLTSDCELPWLVASDRDDVDLTIEPLATAPRPRDVAPDAAAGSCLRVERSAAGFVLRFGPHVFAVSADGTRIRVHGDEWPPSGAVSRLLIDQVVPLALSQMGACVLHGSAVAIDEHAIALLGPSGAGKSTLAGSFTRAGSCLMADDALVVTPGGNEGPCVAHPAYPSLRVWPDVLPALDASSGVAAESTHKRRVAPAQGRFVHEPRRLHRIYLLDSAAASEPTVVAMSRRDAAVALLANSYVLDAADTSRLSRQLSAACDVVQRVGVRLLAFPRALHRLVDVQDAIMRDLSESRVR